MATISGSMFIALDGVVDPRVGNWHFPYPPTGSYDDAKEALPQE
jgi:hypothetical protein